MRQLRSWNYLTAVEFSTRASDVSPEAIKKKEEWGVLSDWKSGTNQRLSVNESKCSPCFCLFRPVFIGVWERVARWRNNNKKVRGDGGIYTAVLYRGSVLKGPQALKKDWERMRRRIVILAEVTPVCYLTFSLPLIQNMFGHYPSHDELNLNWVMPFNRLCSPGRIMTTVT